MTDQMQNCLSNRDVDQSEEGDFGESPVSKMTVKNQSDGAKAVSERTENDPEPNFEASGSVIKPGAIQPLEDYFDENTARTAHNWPRVDYSARPNQTAPASGISEPRHTPLDSGSKLKLVTVSAQTPACSYSNESKRRQKKRCFRCSGSIERKGQAEKSLAEFLSVLDGWNIYETVCVDGMNGMGKSTLAMRLRRSYVKLNQKCPDITNGSTYNMQPLKCLDYVFSCSETWYHKRLPTGQDSCLDYINRALAEDTYDSSDNVYVVRDRHFFSNLIYYACHYLMSVYRETTMPGPCNQGVYDNLEQFVTRTGTLKTISYFQALYDMPTLFLVCSDFETTAKLLLTRGGVNDCYNAARYNYQMAQYHAFSYFADLLQKPIFDLAEVFQKYSIPLVDFQKEIAARIDVPANITYNKEEVCVHVPDREAAVVLHSLLDDIDDSLIFDCSNK